MKKHKLKTWFEIKAKKEERLPFGEPQDISIKVDGKTIDGQLNWFILEGHADGIVTLNYGLEQHRGIGWFINSLLQPFKRWYYQLRYSVGRV